ncbi:MAG: MbnP family protein [Thermaurantimonas sp.]
MMRITCLIAIFFAAVVSCKKDNPDQKSTEAEVVIEFVMHNGTSEVSTGQDFKLKDNRTIYVTELKFYLSHPIFHQSETAQFEDTTFLALVQLHQSESNKIKMRISPGTYSSFIFNPGLDSATNESNPVDFPRGHPLSAFYNMHWNWNLKYRFVLMELRARDFTPPIPCSYHPGTNQLLRQSVVAFDKPYLFEAGKNYKLKILLNVSTIFDGPSGYIDFETENQAHAEPGDFELTKKFMENFAASFTFSSLREF